MPGIVRRTCILEFLHPFCQVGTYFCLHSKNERTEAERGVSHLLVYLVSGSHDSNPGLSRSKTYVFRQYHVLASSFYPFIPCHLTKRYWVPTMCQACVRPWGYRGKQETLFLPSRKIKFTAEWDVKNIFFCCCYSKILLRHAYSEKTLLDSPATHDFFLLWRREDVASFAANTKYSLEKCCIVQPCGFVCVLCVCVTWIVHCLFPPRIQPFL